MENEQSFVGHIGEHEIRVSTGGRIGGYIAYAYRLFEEEEADEVVVTATGNAIPRAIVVVSTLISKVHGLDQYTKTGCRELTDHFTNGGGEEMSQSREVSFVEMRLIKRDTSSENFKQANGDAPPYAAEKPNELQD
eukprot:Filipodium_phascolosomae@DN5635_c0_g1_i1.p1